MGSNIRQPYITWIIVLLVFSRNSSSIVLVGAKGYQKSTCLAFDLRCDDVDITQHLRETESFKSRKNKSSERAIINWFPVRSQTVIYFPIHLTPHKKTTSTMDMLTSTYGILAGAIVAVQAVILKSLGQPLISKSGFVKFWVGEVSGPENSQHISDWYTFSHILHGFIFYEVLYYLVPSWDIGVRFVISVCIEALWEVIENLPSTIERYRQTALAQGYTGDSVLNSICDAFAMAAGFLIADKLPLGFVIALALGSELVMAFAIRDNLTLNVIQLIKPIDFITRWQNGGEVDKKDKKEKRR